MSGDVAGQPNEVLRFGGFELDPERGQLHKYGSLVRLPPQPFKALLLLARRAGDVVTREELRRELWGEQIHVDFDQGMNFTIRQARAVLGDDADHPLYIETIPRRGYRFVAPVERVSRGSPPGVLPRSGDTGLQKALWANIVELRLQAARRRRMAWTAAVVVLLVVALALVWTMSR